MEPRFYFFIRFGRVSLSRKGLVIHDCKTSSTDGKVKRLCDRLLLTGKEIVL